MPLFRILFTVVALIFVKLAVRAAGPNGGDRLILVSIDGFRWDYLHISASPASAMREGNYKLIEFLEDNHVELYDLSRDLSERHDLARSEPARAERMRARLHRWREEVHAEMPRSNPNRAPF